MREPDYQREGVTLYRGDCLEILPELEAGSVDAVITDPPFAQAGGISNGRTSQVDAQFFEHWLASVFREMHQATAPESPWFLWCDWRTASAYDSALRRAGEAYDARCVSQVIVHDREMIGMGSPFRNQTDWIAVVRGKKTDFANRIPKNQPNVIRSYWYYGKHPNHPAEKCPDVADKLVAWASDKGGTILDPFMGSGTTGVACIRTNRRFIGIEKDPTYFEIAVKRIEAEFERTSLFDSAGVA